MKTSLLRHDGWKLIGVLVVLAAVVTGYSASKGTPATPSAPAGTAATPAESGAAGNNAGAKLTVDGKEIMIPGGDTDPKKQQEFSQSVGEMAKEIPEWVIEEDCNLTPQLAKLKYGGTLTVVNNTGSEHTLKVGDAKETIVVKPGQKASVTATFRGPGTYTVNCDKTMNALLHLTKE